MAAPLDTVGTLHVQVVDVVLGWVVWKGTVEWDVQVSVSVSILSEVEVVNGDLALGSHQLLGDNVLLATVVEANITRRLALGKSHNSLGSFDIDDTGIEVSVAVQPDLTSDSVDTTGSDSAVDIEWVVVNGTDSAWVCC